MQQARKGIFNLLSSFRADIQNLGILKSCRNLGLIRLENVVEVNQDFVTRKMATEVMILHSQAMANPLLGNRTYLVPRRGSSGRRKFGGVAAQSVTLMAAAFPSASTELLRKSGYSSVKKQGSKSAVHRTNSVTRPRVVADSAREFAATAIVEKTAEEHCIINPSEALLEKFANMPPSDIGETTAADRLFLWEDVAKLGKLQPCNVTVLETDIPFFRGEIFTLFTFLKWLYGRNMARRICADCCEVPSNSSTHSLSL